MAALQSRIAGLRRQAEHESGPAKATALRNESRALAKPYNALRQQQAQDGGGQAITVCIGVGGLNQMDRDAWNTYARLEPDPPETQAPRMLRSTVARTVPPWRRLLERGWRLLWLPERPGRHERVIDDMMAHVVIYLEQEGMVEREGMVPWLQGYIRTVCGTIGQTDVDYVLEETLKGCTLPMHANSLRAYINETMDQQRRQGGSDK